ncbi:MAG: autotransporter-associated beta strand repeat-containing protein [Thermoguttaceae bacterium]|nr:autotransporter-associated beta strand repeat-containing protein [Thermoguttaceae bacterium]
MKYRFILPLIALALLSVQFANAETYILNDENTTITDPQIADDGETNAIVSSGSGKGFVQGTMTVLGDSTINNSNRVEMTAAIIADAPYTITKIGGGQLLFMNDSSAVGKIVVGAGTVIGQNNANSLNAINGVDLNAGTLQIWNLQNVPGHIYANGGTLQSAGGNNSFTGDITLAAETTIDVTASYTFNTTGTIGSASDDTNVYRINKTNSGTWNIAGTVNCGYFSPGGGTVKVLSGGELNATQLVLKGYSGSGTFTLTVDGGSVKLTGDDYRLGHWSGSVGIVNITSGTFTAANTTTVGWDGTGQLYQTGGTATFGTLDIFRSGSLIEFSGGKTTIGTLNFGVRQNGAQGVAGSVTFKGNSDVSLTNMYAYNTGTLYIQDDANVTVSNQAYFVQKNTSCTFTGEQTGGTFTVNGSLALGHYATAITVYNMKGGTLNVPNYESGGQTGFWLAVDGDGTLNQSGGTINTGRLNLNARDARQVGTYVMTGGTLNVGTGGIMATESGSGRYVIKLEKGTITAGASSLTANKGNWTSNLKMELTGTGADRVTFKPEEGYSITLSGVLSGDGGLIKDGAGTLILSTSSNTYTGDTTVKNGTLKLSKTGGTAGLNPGAKVYVEGANSVLAGNGDILGYKGGAIGGIYLSNGGTFKNDSTNAHITVNNAIYMNNGNIYAEGNGNNDVGNFIFDNAIHVTAGTQNKITATRFVLRSLTDTPFAEGDYAGLIDVDEGAKLTISANISNGSGGTALVKDGKGDLELTANSTYGYGTTIKGGKVILSGEGSLGTGAVVNNATLEFACNTDNTFSAAVTGSGEVVKSGDKTLTLTNSIACEGGVIVSSGTLALSNGFGGDKRFTGDVTIADGAKLLCAAHDSLGFGGDTTVLKIYGTMDNSNDNETLNNTELHMYGGTASSSSGGTFDVLNTGVKFYSYALEGATPENPTVSTISSQINLRTTGTLDISTAANSQLDLTGVIYVGSDKCALKKLGDGVLTLTGNNTYDSGTIIDAGKVVVSGAGTIGTGPASVADGATLEFIVDDGAVKQTGAISGKGTVVKTGNGTLRINNDGADDSLEFGNILVQSGRADVKGLYKGKIEVSGPAVFSPGNSVGTLITDVFTLGSGATLLMEQDASGMDTLIANQFNIADDAIVEYVFTSLPPGATYAIFSDPNGLAEPYNNVDYWASFLTPGDDYYWNITIVGNTVYASVDSNAIPEPSTWALLILGVAGLIYWRRRNA